MPPAKKSQDGSATAKRPADEITNSPLKRIKAAILQRQSARATREQLILSTVDSYRNHVIREETQPVNPDIDVVVVGTLIWTSSHTYGERNMIRLHITDEHPEDSIEALNELEALHGTSAENRSLIDEALLTATVFGETLSSPNLPRNGSRIRITKSRKRMVYDLTKCQLVAKLSDIVTL